VRAELASDASALGARGRLGVAGGVLLAEYLLISLRFDALTVAERGGVWAWVGRVGAIAPLAVVVATTLLLLRRRGSAPLPIELAKPSAPLVALHLLSYAAFFTVTSRVFGSDHAPPGSPWLWLGLFALTALGTGLTLLVGLLGARAVARALSWSMLVAVLIGAAAWGAGQFTTELWSVLSTASLAVVSALVGAFAPIHADPAKLELALEGFMVVVSRECSGLEGIGLIAVLLSAYLIAFRDGLRLPRALLLLPLGVVAAWLGNSLRIAGLMLVGAYLDPALAYGGFHSKLGWVLFCAVALGVAALGQRVHWFRSRPAARSDTESADRAASDEVFENPTAAYLMPALAFTATALVTTMFAHDIDRYYGLRLVAAVAVLVAYRHYYRDLPKEASPVAAVAGLLIGVAWVASAPPGGEAVAVEVDWFWLGVRTIGSVLVVPIVEELAFRGCLMRWLIARDFTRVPFTTWKPLAVVGSSLAFGLLHDRWIAATLVGVLFALLQVRRGRIGDAMLAHAAANGVVSAAAVWTGNLGYWS
jgi:exosortase E/protease (VPEID-CTERM system)